MTSNPLVELRSGPMARLELIRGRGNALTEPVLNELEAAFSTLRAEGSPPVVLTGRGRSFCTGLDLVAAYGLDREGMRALMEAFHRALRACLLYPGPIVAALNGHALAGGALLALACDARVMIESEARFGVHGVRLGVSYPQIAVEVLRARWTRIQFEPLLYQGLLCDSLMALDRGWIDRRVAGDDLIAVAEEEAVRCMDHEIAREAKARISADAARRLSSIDPVGMQAWLDQWFSPATRAAVGEACQALLDRAGPRPGEHPDHQAH